MQAAEAAEAAGEQGKFWEMAERIQSNASQLSPDFFAQAAKDLGLDMDRFNAAMNDHKYAAQIQADIDDGTRKGIASTPTFVINGYRYAGAPTYEQLDAAVKDAAQRLPQ